MGEIGRVGAPGRREIGHGNLAERALLPLVPSEADFPYSLRLESLITESCGSSSMASVCGGCLAMMDAGVPVTRAVAGVAMGLLLDEDGGQQEPIILTDILGIEDALGTMDLKVAGDRDGITAFQMDIKCEGLSIDTLATALEQAREGRLHILDEMAKGPGGAVARAELPPTVPKLERFKVSPGDIGKIIGPGGKNIRATTEQFSLTNIDVQDDGSVTLSGMKTTDLAAAKDAIERLLAGGGGGRQPARSAYAGPWPEIGTVFRACEVVSVKNFGAFVLLGEAYPNLEGQAENSVETPFSLVRRHNDPRAVLPHLCRRSLPHQRDRN